MNEGQLSRYFSGVAAKRLSAVEILPERSRQHEFNGTSDLIRLLGDVGPDKCHLHSRFLYLDDSGEQATADSSDLTWYDARAKSAARTGRSEYRLYFPANEVTQRAQQSDLLLIARRETGDLIVIIAKAESTIAVQLLWLFGLGHLNDPGFTVRAAPDFGDESLGIVAATILREIGVEPDLADTRYLDFILAKFGKRFPSTREFSACARESASNANPIDDPDAALMAWMDREEILFRTLEKHLIGERLRDGFFQVAEPDVDGFMQFSLSVQNRRKARAGAALENHIEAVLIANGLRYSRGALTERNNRPDFIFPGSAEYNDHLFPSGRLTVLAAKTTAKDRWRQITKEADRVPLKHLLTLEPAISENQTQQMRESAVQLVIPTAVHGDYTATQVTWLLRLRDFIQGVRARQQAE